MVKTCGDHGGTAKSTGNPCQRPEGWGTDFNEGKCKFHRGTNSDGSSHKDNQNAKTHAAFSKHFRSDLTESEEESLQALIDTLEDISGPRAIPAEVAAEALMKYKRSADSRFLREARQWMSEFNLLPNDDTLNIGASDDLANWIAERVE